ncbi:MULTISPECIES: hypothetical protein [unclassified Mesorhizobium]|uniref:hypothetical protein n=1 Tax=unclassified Mesorhizobium TaxID=325217 RepID=UPI000FCC19D7|nr:MULTISPECIES: hypothetical protein [unclassified Mesorhizobium]TGP24883.1 hypothetical protein EN874_007065 [Mesorhizobium sp. M1D.F.Ca.ET.231.01.1.1]TGP36206.1 hypothetical protein EN877_07065 [Mesorhizobium sp. M1D.F.Ca.ET.234.01.1.1]TGS49708.1 hypothetical protein EN827_07065 [Mesorhizobium sp. M1D.F.Ca.ET.184.01.1.1]TGS64420.1 hypothetical protein EN826_007065 [Mesorhizobium sp. M1D.F.Ca.ET.183.01.1.1]
MKRSAGLGVALVVLSAGLAAAQEAEWTPAYLGCTFTHTAFSSHSELPWMAGEDNALKVTEDEFELTFAAIDLVGRRAQLVGNQGAAEVAAQRGGYGSVCSSSGRRRVA